MSSLSYRVSQALIPPVVLAMGFGLYLLYMERNAEKLFFTGLVLLPFYYIGIEILVRKIIIDETGITVHKLFRQKRMEWADIEHVDAVAARQKMFLILQDRSARTIIITNTIDSFRDLVEQTLERIEKHTIAPKAIDLLADPPISRGPVIQAWLACAVILGIIIAKLMGYGA